MAARAVSGESDSTVVTIFESGSPGSSSATSDSDDDFISSIFDHGDTDGRHSLRHLVELERRGYLEDVEWSDPLRRGLLWTIDVTASSSRFGLVSRRASGLTIKESKRSAAADLLDELKDLLHPPPRTSPALVSDGSPSSVATGSPTIFYLQVRKVGEDDVEEDILEFGLAWASDKGESSPVILHAKHLVVIDFLDLGFVENSQHRIGSEYIRETEVLFVITSALEEAASVGPVLLVGEDIAEDVQRLRRLSPTGPKFQVCDMAPTYRSFRQIPTTPWEPADFTQGCAYSANTMDRALHGLRAFLAMRDAAKFYQ